MYLIDCYVDLFCMSYLWCLILWIVCVKFGLLLICSALADWLLFVLILVSLIGWFGFGWFVWVIVFTFVLGVGWCVMWVVVGSASFGF